MLPTSEDDILVSCSRVVVGKTHRERLLSTLEHRVVNWDLLWSTSMAHKVTPLVHRNLLSCPLALSLMPAQVADRFRDMSRRFALRNRLALRGIAGLVAGFSRRSHDVLLLKHAAFAVHIPTLYDFTMAEDVDLVVRPAGEAAFPPSGRYSWSGYAVTDATWAVIDETAAAGDQRAHPWAYEIDNRIHHDILWNGVIPIDFQKVWADADRGQVEGKTVLVPCIEDMMILSSINLFRKSRFRLRNLVEISELIRGEQGLDWSEVARKAQGYRCVFMVHSALSMSRDILGAVVPEGAVEALGAGTMRRTAIAIVNGRFSPTAACRRDGQEALARLGRRGLGDVVRRLLALEVSQALRFIWLRVILKRLSRDSESH